MKEVLVSSANMGRMESNICCQQESFKTDFICYNDTNFSTRHKSMSSRLLGKIPKMLSWELAPDYKYYLWIDSIFNIKMEDSVKWFIENLGDKDAIFFKHPHRKTVREELSFCVDNMNIGNKYLLERYDGERMEDQIKSYFAEGFTDDLLLAAGAFLYKSSIVEDKNYNIMKEWFYHNCFYSVQDQLSLPFLLKKFNINFGIIEENIYTCRYIN